MPQLFSEALEVMMDAFRQFEASVTPPTTVARGDSFVFRYENKGIHEALIQKLARYISGLNATTVLLKAGYAQEIGVLFRTLDEIQEDIFFLAVAETNNARTDRHEQYLNAFYEEAIFSRPEGSIEIKKPNLVPRKKIRAHTLNTLGTEDSSKAQHAAESISTAYSGYVHAASENVMDMYGGSSPHFHLTGMPATSRIQEMYEDIDNYVYRGLMATIAIAKAFGDSSLVVKLDEFLAKYEQANGHRRYKRSSDEL